MPCQNSLIILSSGMQHNTSSRKTTSSLIFWQIIQISKLKFPFSVIQFHHLLFPHQENSQHYNIHARGSKCAPQQFCFKITLFKITTVSILLFQIQRVDCTIFSNVSSFQLCICSGMCLLYYYTRTLIKFKKK